MKKLAILLIISFLLSSCSLFSRPKEYVPVPTYIPQTIAIKEHPSPINLLDVNFMVVNEKELDEFLRLNKEAFGGIVFVALTVPDYENLAYNRTEFKRYIEQLQAVVLYYEERISNEQNENKKPTKD